MNLTQLLTSEKGQQLVGQLADQFNLSPEQATEAAKQLMPAIQSGMLNRVKENPSALTEIFGGKEQEIESYVQDGQIAGDTNQIAAAGNNILGQIFGSKDVSREVASRAAENTGIDATALKSMLPMLASLAGSQLLSGGKQSSGGGLMGNLLGGLLGGKKSGGLNASLLTKMLDQDGDGSIADDLMGMAGKFLKK